MRAVLDLDWCKYTASSAGEKRQIRVIHKASGREKVFKTRTEFYGAWQKKNGGYLAEINKSRTSPFLVDDFDIIDEQIPEPIENVFHTAKLMVDGAIKQAGCDSYVGFLGKGDSWRKERSTILEYKGTRSTLIKPLYLDDVTEYLIKRYNAEVITHLEADDRCVMEAYKKKDHVVIGVDKDFYGCDINFFNVNRVEEGVVDCSGIGILYLDKKKVRGTGMTFMLHQVLSGDSTDNYKANSASGVPWGEMASYNLLHDKTTYRDLWQAVVDGYKTIYPTPSKVVGWRGDEIEVDWLYMLQENFDMARMIRYDGDEVDVKVVLERLKVDYE